MITSCNSSSNSCICPSPFFYTSNSRCFFIDFFNDYLNNNLLVIILVVSLVTMFIAGISATLETDFKKIVAFSTLSQIGILFFMLSVNKKTICLFHLYSHAFFKRILFIGVGVVLHTSISSQEARDMVD